MARYANLAKRPSLNLGDCLWVQLPPVLLKTCVGWALASLSSECGRIARDFAKVEDQVRFLTRMFICKAKERLDQHQAIYLSLASRPNILAPHLTLEPDGQATGCNPGEVGSIPTGVFSREEKQALPSAA